MSRRRREKACGHRARPALAASPPERPCETRPRSYDRSRRVRMASRGTRCTPAQFRRGSRSCADSAPLSAAQTPAARSTVRCLQPRCRNPSWTSNPLDRRIGHGSEVPSRSGPIVLVLPLGSKAFAARRKPCGRDFSPQPAPRRRKPRRHRARRRRRDDGLRQGESRGARVIVGPLVRDDMKTLAVVREPICRRRSHSISSTKERRFRATSISSRSRSTARRAQLARLARERRRGDRRGDRQRHAAAAAFRERLQRRMDPRRRRRAGDVSLRPDAGCAAPAEARARQDAPVDVALLAVDAADAARGEAVRRDPFRATTSSEVNERQPPDALRDLDNVRFVEIPWLVDADATAFADSKRPDYPQPVARAALRARHGRLPSGAGVRRRNALERLEFDGATGHLSLDSNAPVRPRGRG